MGLRTGVGFIYVALASISKEFGFARVSAKLRQRVAGALQQEIATYSDDLRGNTYGYVIEQDGEEVDACKGLSVTMMAIALRSAK